MKHFANTQTPRHTNKQQNVEQCLVLTSIDSERVEVISHPLWN